MSRRNEHFAGSHVYPLMDVKPDASPLLAPGMQGGRRQKLGFTLIELLVVITIIMLLIAILLPAVNRAEQVMHRAKCMSNLRQVGLALFMYAEDNNGWLPFWEGTEMNNNMYVLTPDYLASPEGMFCPSAAGYSEHWRNNTTPITISGNHGWLVPADATMAAPGLDDAYDGRNMPYAYRPGLEVRIIDRLSEQDVIMTDRSKPRYDSHIPGHGFTLNFTDMNYLGNRYNHEYVGVHALYIDNRVEFVETQGNYQVDTTRLVGHEELQHFGGPPSWFW